MSSHPTEISSGRKGDEVLAATKRIRVLVAGGRKQKLGEALSGALRHNHCVVSAELVSEAAEAEIWARFGAVDLVVVFPDASPFPKDFASELHSHGCKLIGVYEADDWEGEKTLEQNSISLRVPLGRDLHAAACLLIETAIQGALERLGSRPTSGTGHSHFRGRAPSGSDKGGLVAVAGLGRSAGISTITVALSGYVRKAGLVSAIVDFDLGTLGLTRWLGSVAKKKLRTAADFESDENRPSQRSIGSAQYVLLSEIRFPAENVSLPPSKAISWKVSALSTGEFVACASARSEIFDPDEVLLEQEVSFLLAKLKERVDVIIADVGAIRSACTCTRYKPILRGISRLEGLAPKTRLTWILVCRGDPGSVRAFVECWPLVEAEFKDSKDIVVVLNGVLSGTSNRKLHSQRKALHSAIDCATVIEVPHDIAVADLFWSPAGFPKHAHSAEFANAIRSLADAAGLDVSGPVSENGVSSNGPLKAVVNTLRRRRSE